MDKNRFLWPVRPVALPENIIKGSCYRFTVLTSRLIRLEFDASGIFEDRASQTVFYRDFPKCNFKFTDINEKIIIETEHLKLLYNENEAFSENSLCIQLKNEPASCWQFGKKYENLGGTVKTLDNVNGEVKLESGLCSRNGFSCLDDSDRLLLDETGWVVPRKSKTLDFYFFGYGYDYQDCIKDFYRLTGAPALLPDYALGNWWSRYHQYTQKEYTDLIDRFKKEDIPFSVAVVDMDWHITEIPECDKDGISSGWTGYTWNKDLFPDYKSFIEYLHKNNLKTSLNLHPAGGIVRFEEQYEKMAVACGFDPKSGKRIPFNVLSPEFMANYFDVLHHPLEDDGVDFWWMDWQQGSTYWWIHEENKNGKLQDEREALDPLWMINHLHVLDISRNGKRPMFFSRYSGPGSHRYSIGFSGDTHVSWKSLQFQPYFTANASNIGYGWWSHDIGGHMFGYRNDELTTRWIQLGVFSPINRLHSTNNEFQGKEPWNYSDEACRIIKEWLRLRHRLFPYIYTMNYRCNKQLIPLITPMYYSYPRLQSAYDFKNQYFFGSELMVAPITSPKNSISLLGRADAWLPQGDWFDFFSGTHYQCSGEFGRKISLFRPLKSYPVLAKAGGIVPLNPHIAGDNSLKNSNALDVVVFPGQDNHFELYQDAGDMNDYKDGAFVTTGFDLKWGESPVFEISPASGKTDILPETRKYNIMLRGFNTSVSVKLSVDGADCEFECKVDESTHTVTISFTAAVSALVKLNIQGNELINNNSDYLKSCFDILNKSNLSIERKSSIIKILRNEKTTVAQKLSDISVQSLEEQELVDSLEERLTLCEDEN